MTWKDPKKLNKPQKRTMKIDKIIPLVLDITGRVRNPIPIMELIKRKKTVIIWP
jgi:hypothetical protein